MKVDTIHFYAHAARNRALLIVLSVLAYVAIRILDQTIL